jgi:hypothetical protein
VSPARRWLSMRVVLHPRVEALHLRFGQGRSHKIHLCAEDARPHLSHD